MENISKKEGQNFPEDQAAALSLSIKALLKTTGSSDWCREREVGASSADTKPVHQESARALSHSQSGVFLKTLQIPGNHNKTLYFVSADTAEGKWFHHGFDAPEDGSLSPERTRNSCPRCMVSSVGSAAGQT